MATVKNSRGEDVAENGSKRIDPATKKEAILRAAQEVFGELGYSGTTMKMIAERAGVAFGLVSHYYGSKEELFRQAGVDMVDTIFDRVLAEVSYTDSGLATVRKFVRIYFAQTLENTSRFKILVRFSPYSDDEPQIDRSIIADKFREFIEELQYHILRGIRDGTIRNVPAEETAFIIYGTMVGAVRTVLVTPYEIDGIYEEAVEFITRSIEKRPVKRAICERPRRGPNPRKR